MIEPQCNRAHIAALHAEFDGDVLAVGERLDRRDVVNGMLGLARVAIARRKGVLPAPDARAIAACRMQGLFQPVVPVAYGRHDFLFEFGDIGIDGGAAFARDDEVDAHQRGFAEIGLEADDVPVIGLGQDFTDPSRRSVLNRSRGMKTKAETKRSKRSRRTKSRMRGRSSSRRMPRAMFSSVSASIWKSSSRGKRSSTLSSALPEWLDGENPLTATTRSLRRSSGISLGFCV